MSITLINKSSIYTTNKFNNFTSKNTGSNTTSFNSTSTNVFSNIINNNDTSKITASINTIQTNDFKVSNKVHNNKKFKILEIHKKLQQHGYFTSCTEYRRCNHKYCLKCNKLYWFKQQTILKSVNDIDAVKQTLILTLDAPTYLNNHFEDIYKSINDSKKELFDSRLFKRLKNEIGIEALNCNLDFVYSSKYGYRPHYHCLIFLNKTISELKLKQVKGEIIQKWQHLISKNYYKNMGEQHHVSSSKAFRKYSVDLKPVNDIQHLSYYVSKTVGYESNYINEVTNSFNKVGRVPTSYSIMDLYKNLVSGGSESLPAYKTDFILQTFFRVMKSQKASSWYFKSSEVKEVIASTKKKLKEDRKNWVEQNIKTPLNKIEIEYLDTIRNEYQNKQIFDCISKFIIPSKTYSKASKSRVNTNRYRNVLAVTNTCLNGTRMLNRDTIYSSYTSTNRIIIKPVINQYLSRFEGVLINSS